jgi:tetratricopeptide (TPR) repeat protein
MKNSQIKITKQDELQIANSLKEAQIASEQRDVDHAISIVTKLLGVYPAHHLIHRTLGILKLQKQANVEAEEILLQCTILNPADALSRKYYGAALLRNSKAAEGLEQLKLAETGLPDDAELNYFAAQGHTTSGKLSDALSEIGKALAKKPDDPNYLHNLAVILARSNREKSALPALYQALDISPNSWNIRLTLAHLLMKIGRAKEAISHYGEVLRDSPERLEAMTNLGIAYMVADELSAAEEQFKKLINLYPKDPEPYQNLANLHSKMNRYEESIQNYETALDLQPVFPNALVNYSVTLRKVNRVEETIGLLKKAIEQRADLPEAHWNLSLSYLLLGDLENGFDKYEWRWKGAVKELTPRKLPGTLWDGKESLKGKTIFIHSEQGLGDHIQYIRFLPVLESMGATVIAEFPEPLLDFAKRFSSSIIWLKRGAHKFPKFDLFCPLMSLPHRFGTNHDTIPSVECYKNIEIPVDRITHYKKKIADNGKLNVGLVWAGNPKHHNDLNRSMGIDALSEGILKLPANFISLMKEYNSDTKSAMAKFGIQDFHEELEDFTETSALLMNMDIVITVDTSVAHLAAALGKPVWILLPFAPDWRWLLDGDKSAWYPNITLFRQPTPHDWMSATSRVEAELAKEIQKHQEHLALA